jgi:hypothetical protein
VIFEILPVIMSLAIWAGYEFVSDDGARARLTRPAAVPRVRASGRIQDRATGADSPTIESKE